MAKIHVARHSSGRIGVRILVIMATLEVRVS